MKPKLIRITTVPISLEKLLEGQLRFMKDHYEVTAISAEKEKLSKYGLDNEIITKHIKLTRKITPVDDLRALYNLYKYLRKIKPFIVHSHTPKAGIVGMLAAYLAKVPNRVHTVAGLPLMEATGFKRKILNIVEKITYKCATRVYPNSKGLHSFILNEGLTNLEKLKVIGNGSSNGIDTDYFHSSLFTNSTKHTLRDALGINQNEFIYIFVGRLVGDKGINELITAFCSLQKKNNNIGLLLVGNFEKELDPLQSKTLKSIHNNSKIYSVGYQYDVRPYFAIANVLVFPSYREGFPNVVLQAGAMGLPSIVSNINGCNEIIKPKINGLIIDVKNTTALKDAMQKLFTENDLYLTLKLNARKQILESYNRVQLWDKILEEYKTYK